MKYLIALSSILLLLSCSDKPGYRTRITIEKKAGITQSDIHLIKDILKSHPFETVMEKEENTWKIESYNIRLEAEKFYTIENKYVGFSVESWCSSKQNAPCKIEIRIGNSREGRKSIVKAEIDHITDQLIENISKKVDESQFQVKRAYTTPM